MGSRMDTCLCITNSKRSRAALSMTALSQESIWMRRHYRPLNLNGMISALFYNFVTKGIIWICKESAPTHTSLIYLSSLVIRLFRKMCLLSIWQTSQWLIISGYTCHRLRMAPSPIFSNKMASLRCISTRALWSPLSIILLSQSILNWLPSLLTPGCMWLLS